MKTFLRLACFLLTVFSVSAHEYHFAFAESEYNTETQTIQTTITVSTHDFEHTLIDQGMDIGHLESYHGHKLMELALADELLAHFTMQLGDQSCGFKLLGYEVLNSGMTHFYFESEPLTFHPEITVRFDLMMDANPEQQNKLTFIYRDQKKTVPFLFNNRTQQIIFEN